VSEAAERSWFGNSCLLGRGNQNPINGRRHFTIPNAVNVTSIDQAIATRSETIIVTALSLADRPVIGTVSRLSSEKGIDILLRAFVEVKRFFPEAHLLIVGDGNRRTELGALSRKLCIDQAITWTGSQPWKDAIGYLSLMDIVAVPSKYEGFGLTAVEAMACNKSVVASDVDGLAEIIRDGVTGFLVAVEDSFALAGALVSLLRDKEQRQTVGSAARSHVKKTYAYPQFRERWQMVYESLWIA
jgi:glycosyltransferase involved in cell wall biosynthesis